METRQLGNTDLHLTLLGMGAWAIGGQWEWGWGAQDEKDSIAAVHQAVASGMNWIDTAPVYGLGTSESVIGKAVAQLPASERPLIFTKCGFNWNEQRDVTPALSAASIKAEVDASLKRLGVETIDLYQIHWPNPEAEIEEGWQAIQDTIAAGKIRYAGVSNFNVEQMQRIQPIGPIASLQPRYNALHREIETEQLPFCQQENIGVIAYSPMASGLLTGKMTRERIASLAEDDWRRRAEDFVEPALTKNLELVDRMASIAEEESAEIADVALAFVLAHKAMTAAIVGLRHPDQVAGVRGGATLSLSDSDINFILHGH